MADLHDFSIAYRKRAVALLVLRDRDDRMDALAKLFTEMDAARDPDWLIGGTKRLMGMAAGITGERRFLSPAVCWMDERRHAAARA